MATNEIPFSPIALIKREQHNRILVRGWLYIICALVFVMVIVGGATRLTDSGLSITEWQPIIGAIPPLSHSDWLEAFEKYQQIPQYNQINQGMSLEAFEEIYWWEWTHRFLGRFIGIAVILPLIFFWASGRLEARLKPRLLLLFLLGGLQGFIGWWMVVSGLVDRTDVSQYRLAVHLTLACIIFAYGLWLARGLAPHDSFSGSVRLRLLASFVTMLVLLQIFAGGLVAGLNAGLAFNDWPTMDGAIIPADLLLLEPAWRNFFENPKMVQFVHRSGAYLLVIAMSVQVWFTWKWESDPAHCRRAAILLGLSILQAGIGIVTLMTSVPIAWALLHQAGALVLLGFAIAHWRGLLGAIPPVTALERRC
jgi:heme a synthase